MLRQTLRIFNEKSSQLVLKASLSTSQSEKWDLLTAVCVERKPIITPELTELEKKFQTLLTNIEFERSLKSDHEIKHESEIKQIELLKQGKIDTELETNLKQTTQDFIDACTDELNKFQFASRKTEADKKNDVKSLHRKLDKHLVLLINQKVGNKNFYLLPQGEWQEGETLRQTAERVLNQNCKDLKVTIFGNAPAGVYKYRYPLKIRDEKKSVGAKIYFYFARYKTGEFPQKGVDYKWLDRTELDQMLPKDYSKSVRQFLIDEEERP